jgi:23S rRNA (pseudouridine1915-N3)-methyltransferase
MKLVLLVSGKTEEKYLRDGISEYEERIKRYAGFEIRDAGSLKNTASMPVPEQKRREADLFQRYINPGDIVVLLDERGKEMRSVEFAAFLNRHFLSGNKTLVFIVGGPYGFDEVLKQRAGAVISLSKMTFSHQMVRLIFTEQLYRALTILKNESYHHE